MDFINQQTTQTAKALLGVKIIYQDDYQTYTGYIVETEAYLGIQDKAAHGFGGKITPKVTSLYKRWHDICTCDAYALINQFCYTD